MSDDRNGPKKTSTHRNFEIDDALLPGATARRSRYSRAGGREVVKSQKDASADGAAPPAAPRDETSASLHELPTVQFEAVQGPLMEEVVEEAGLSNWYRYAAFFTGGYLVATAISLMTSSPATPESVMRHSERPAAVETAVLDAPAAQESAIAVVEAVPEEAAPAEAAMKESEAVAADEPIEAVKEDSPAEESTEAPAETKEAVKEAPVEVEVVKVKREKAAFFATARVPLMIRKGPDQHTARVGGVKAGARLEALGRKPHSAYIKVRYGKVEGWVAYIRGYVIPPKGLTFRDLPALD